MSTLSILRPSLIHWLDAELGILICRTVIASFGSYQIRLTPKRLRMYWVALVLYVLNWKIKIVKAH